MMDEKELEMIHKLAHELCGEDLPCSACIGINNNFYIRNGECMVLVFAATVIRKGYCKVTDGDVVLTSGQFDDLTETQNLLHEEEKDQVRKVTAKEIFEKIHQKEGYYPLASVGTSQNDMTAIAKEYGINYTPYGVEVEE